VSGAERTEEERLRAKRINAVVMMAAGAVMAACGLAAGLIALHPGAFPDLMSGAWRRSAPEPFRRPRKVLVPFAAWGPEPFARARAARKLVLLHLSVDWSADGRLMEDETYADPETAALIAARFVPVRADAEDRPELAARYGVGAWPATLLLLPDGRAAAAASRLTPALFREWAAIIDDGLRASPDKAADLAADAERRFAAVRALPARDPAALPLDPVWGGAYRGRGDYAKTLADQAAVAVSTDAARARAALAFAERFLALPEGGWAAAARGEVDLADGRIAQGAYYFDLDDAGRRALGLPALDRRFLPRENAAMARAVLKSPDSGPAQKAFALRALRRSQTPPRPD
jgi:hypothetical protein